MSDGNTLSAQKSDRDAPVRSPVRWAGSKRKLLPSLDLYWHDRGQKYIEAFAGSACLFFHLRPAVAVLNDANQELVDAYRVLASQPILLHSTLCDLSVNREVYEWFRSTFVPRDSFEAAVRFFYLNRFCFNGIYRTNKKGGFNVPFASYKTGDFPNLRNWREAAGALKTAQLESDDFEVVVRRHVEKGDFVYLDPPYAVSNRRIFKQYSADEFGIEDLHRLRALMDYIDSIGATFVVSYALSKETSILSRGWKTQRKLAQRNVAGFSHHRRKAVEIIITNAPN